MSGGSKSLRGLVTDWFGNGENLRVTRPDRSRKMPWRAVRIEVARSSGMLAIVFFRHDDGSWCVYPPSTVQPATNWVLT
ncbi:hypothetical protein DWV00_01060 [Trinickia dinghuensis]|uniref:Uncharacterized protein n=1 Tax=Trinickia dinghuensis TaxID=2291023 RepID=A0A3D8K781_9BURK|nr:hypothetical protein DWV00_01060 [Trinickia dinghuensis]